MTYWLASLPLWPGTWRLHGVKVLCVDLAAVGAAWINEAESDERLRKTSRSGEI